MKLGFTVPNSWGMYTLKGDRALTKAATTLVNRVNRAKHPSQVVKAIETYYSSLKRKSGTRAMEEASDTVVVEAAAHFVEKVAEATDIGCEIADKLRNRYFY